MTTKEKATSRYQLAMQFLAESACDSTPHVWHVGNQWHLWTGKDYQPVCAEIVEQRVLRFLVQGDQPISVSVIREIVALLQIMQHREVATTPCWLNGNDSCPRDIIATRNGLLHIRDDGTQLLPHDPNLFGLQRLSTISTTTLSAPNGSHF